MLPRKTQMGFLAFQTSVKSDFAQTVVKLPQRKDVGLVVNVDVSANFVIHGVSAALKRYSYFRCVEKLSRKIGYLHRPLIRQLLI